MSVQKPNRPYVVFAVAALGFETVCNRAATAFGDDSAAPAFGNDRQLKAAEAESPTVQVGWISYSPAAAPVKAAVDELNSAGPYPLLTGAGFSAQDIADLKLGMRVVCLPTETHWCDDALEEVLASFGYVLLA